MLGLRNLIRFGLTTSELRPKECYYKTLEVSPTSEMNAIRQSYLDMVKKYHPDLSTKPNTTQMFTLVQKAYEVLSDQVTKKEYDIQRGYHKISSGTNAEAISMEETEQRMKKIRDKFINGEQNRRKDLLNDELNFSYKLYRTHFDKVQNKKPEYNKFNDDQGYYYEKKDYKTPPLYKSYGFVSIPVLLGLGYWVSTRE